MIEQKLRHPGPVFPLCRGVNIRLLFALFSNLLSHQRETAR